MTEKRKGLNITILVTGLIGLCFLWTSSGYLSWMYHLIDIIKAKKLDMNIDILTEVIGYLFQAFGLLAGLIVAKIIKNKIIPLKKILNIGIIIIVLDMITICLACIFDNLLVSLIIGYTMNIMHGLVAAFYLYFLTAYVRQQRKGFVFGAGYGIGSIGSYLISIIGEDNLLRKNEALFIYGILVLLTILLLVLIKLSNPIEQPFDKKGQNTSRNIVVLGIIVILLLSFVKSIGFYFPMADVSGGSVSLELTRVFYLIGLLSAGFINDYNRKLGGVLCVAALIIPFVLIFMSNNYGGSVMMWVVGYVFTGFFTVYRVILFSDLAYQKNSLLYLSGAGLMIGRVGDATGSYTGICLASKSDILMIVGAFLFVATVIIFFSLYQKLYINNIENNVTISYVGNDNQIKEHNSIITNSIDGYQRQYSLSSREIEVLKLVLEKHTNTEISEILFISENTVKFHMKNILKKTECSNRHELIELLK